MPEQPTARKVLEQEEQRLEPKIDLREEAGNLPVSAEENYLRRKAEVTQQDYEEFLLYKEAKARQTEAAQAPQPVADEATKSTKVNRRNFLTVVAGTAAV